MLVAALIATIEAFSTKLTYSKALDASEVAFQDTADGLANPNTFALAMQLNIGICGLTALGLFVLIGFALCGLNARIPTIVFCGGAWLFITAGIFYSPAAFGWGGPPGDPVTIARVKSAEGIPSWARAAQISGSALNAVLLASIVVLISIDLYRGIKARDATSQPAVA